MPTRFQSTLDYGTRGQQVPTLPRRTHTLRPTQSAILPVNQGSLKTTLHHFQAALIP